MSDDTTTNAASTTAGDAGTSTQNETATAKSDTSRYEGLNMAELVASIEKMLEPRLSAFKATQEQDKAETTPNTQEAATTTVAGKVYTEEEMQRSINRAVKARLTEKDEQFTKRIDALKKEWLAEIGPEFEKQKAAAIKEAIAARDFESQKKALQTELGLTDTQLARLQGKTLDELRADAAALGFIKVEEKREETKPAPRINPGTHTSAAPSGSTSDSLAEQVRAGLRDGIIQ